ncbi:MAG TPA: GTPase HflX [Thermodesulfobium narugense]|nr:GTPase HflX [Thermodesulfobium narugense]
MLKNLLKSKPKRALILETYHSNENVEYFLDETKALCLTANFEPVVSILYKLKNKDSSFFIGKGKAEEIKKIILENEIEAVIIDDEVDPHFFRFLSDFWDVELVDKSLLIISIFAKRASTKQGKLQVELARLNYLLSQTSGWGKVLSRLGGGIGTRGPGETKKEIDKRALSLKISKLKNEIKLIEKRNRIIKKRRNVSNFPNISLVGYTNAGKSTLMNILTSSNVLVKDQLFSTLDTKTAIIKFDDDTKVFLTDTVGFIRKLPHRLVEAFKATLSQISESELLLHVVDASKPVEIIKQDIKSVNDVLKEINSNDIPGVLVFNKIDKCTNLTNIHDLAQLYKPYCLISAVTGYGINELLAKIKYFLYPNRIIIKIFLPHEKTKIINLIKNFSGKILEKEWSTSGVKITLDIPQDYADFLNDYII